MRLRYIIGTFWCPFAYTHMANAVQPDNAWCIDNDRARLPMDKKAVAERLRALAADDEKRSRAARLRDVLDDVEMALAAGARRADVLAILAAHGLGMSLATFETTLKRLRAKRRQQAAATGPARAYGAPAPPQEAPPAPSLLHAESGTCPSHDPADLDRIINTRPDLAALAKVAKRTRT